MIESARAPWVDLALRLRFLIVVVLPAGALMAMEIVSSRLLAPTFGNSVYVWGAIISVFLAAMSAGYVFGGRVADREPALAALGRLILLAALCTWAAALFGRDAVRWVGELTRGAPAGALLAGAVVYGPATFFLSTVAPFAVRLAGSESSRLGGIAGGLYALSTAGSLVGTLIATFVLVPRLDLDTLMTVLLTAIALAAVAAIGFGAARRGRVFLAAALACAVVPWILRPGREMAAGVLVERITPYQTLVVREEDGLRRLTSDGVSHGAVEASTLEPAIAHPNYWSLMAAAWLIQPQAKRVAVLGLGAGDGARYLSARFPTSTVEAVEIDPAIVEVARQYFGFQPGPRLSVTIADGRRFLVDRAAPTERWDVIVADTYIGAAVPFHLTTSEFFALVEDRLTPGGVLAVNVAASMRHPFSRAILRTLRSRFDQVLVLRAPLLGNHLLFAYDGARNDGEMVRNAALLDETVGGVPRFASYLDLRVRLDTDLVDVPILVDGFAPVDSLLNLADREASFEHLPH